MFGTSESTLDSEIRWPPPPSISPTIYGPPTTFSPLDSEVFSYQVEGENNSTTMPQHHDSNPTFESTNNESFQDVADQLQEVDQILIVYDDVDFFDFPSNDVKISNSEVLGSIKP